MFTRGNKSVSMYEFSHSFSRYFLSAYSVPNIPLVLGNERGLAVLPFIQRLASFSPMCLVRC